MTPSSKPIESGDFAADRQERRLSASRRAFDRDVFAAVDRAVDAGERMGFDVVRTIDLPDGA
jgi:hypothetical protein